MTRISADAKDKEDKGKGEPKKEASKMTFLTGITGAGENNSDQNEEDSKKTTLTDITYLIKETNISVEKTDNPDNEEEKSAPNTTEEAESQHNHSGNNRIGTDNKETNKSAS
eukprot:758057-Ditylum_brightwellii.AAC.1